MLGISPWQLLILLLIVLVLFGTKRLRNIGGDLGSALRSFRKGMSDSEEEDPAQLKADKTEETLSEEYQNEFSDTKGKD